MDYSIQSIHRLPVLNYDVSYADKALNIDGNYVGHATDNVKETNGKTRDRHFDIGSKLSNKKIKVKEHKYQLRRKSANIKNIKEKLSVYSTYFKGHFPSTNTLEYAKNKKHKNTSKRRSDIKVLFSSDTSKSKIKQRKINQALINDIYDLEENCYCDNRKNIYKQPHNIVNCKVTKRPEQRIRNSLALNDVKRTNLRNSSSTPSYGCNIPHYKVLNFPDYDITDIELEEINVKKENLNSCQCQTDNEIRIQKNEKGAVTSNYSNTQRGGGDCATVSNECDLKEVCIKSEHPDKESEQKLKSSYTIKTLYNPIMLNEHVIYLAKGALKFIIFALALIVWSPCIIALCFCWLVTYPLRPNHVPRSSRCKSKSVVKIHVHGSKRTIDNSIQTCQDSNTWSPLIRGINLAVNSISISFGVLKSLLHSGKNNTTKNNTSKIKGRHGNKRCLMTSSPKNKYTLYYSKNKGWVMKCAQRNRRDNCSQWHKKCVRTVASEPLCVKSNNKYTIGVNASCCSRNQRSQRSQSYPGKPRVLKPQNKVGTPLTCCCHHRHRHLCTNTPGLPAQVKFFNPVYNNARLKRPALLKNSFDQTQKPVPPQQLNYKSLKKQDTQLTFRKKLYQYCKDTASNINRVIDDVETEIWRNDIRLGDTYIFTLRKKPCFFVYKICPSLYPVFLTTYKLYKNLCHFFLLVISACIWCPLLAFCYMCYAAFCRSL